MGVTCLFHKSSHVTCTDQGGESTGLVKITPTRLTSIIEKSKIRGDTLHIELNEQVPENARLSLSYHAKCVSSYTSTHHVQRYLKRHGNSNIKPDSHTPKEKRTRRSEIPKFVWKEDCFFCGEKCDMQRDPKHPDRFRSAYECHTSDRPGVSSKTFKDTVLKVFIIFILMTVSFF